jgi:hypothetical protein
VGDIRARLKLTTRVATNPQRPPRRRRIRLQGAKSVQTMVLPKEPP